MRVRRIILRTRSRLARLRGAASHKSLRAWRFPLLAAQPLLAVGVVLSAGAFSPLLWLSAQLVLFGASLLAWRARRPMMAGQCNCPCECASLLRPIEPRFCSDCASCRVRRGRYFGVAAALPSAAVGGLLLTNYMVTGEPALWSWLPVTILLGSLMLYGVVTKLTEDARFPYLHLAADLDNHGIAIPNQAAYFAWPDEVEGQLAIEVSRGGAAEAVYGVQRPSDVVGMRNAVLRSALPTRLLPLGRDMAHLTPLIIDALVTTRGRLVAIDLAELGGVNLTHHPFAERRALLEQTFYDLDLNQSIHWRLLPAIKEPFGNATVARAVTADYSSPWHRYRSPSSTPSSTPAA